jgi:isopentenyl diphosphate isomerase/L-lactate dehydrogenase-like FMN-dependent dehydrogenase
MILQEGATMTAPFGAYQAEIYLNGLAGVLPEFTTDANGLEESARQRLEPGPFWYVAGAAGTGATARANREAFDRWRIVPRMLRDATNRNLSTTVLGTEMPAPILTAPVGVQSILHPDGELATARAAAALGLPMVLSTASSYSIEEVAAAGADGPRWFQLYWPNDDEVCASLLRRAQTSGFHDARGHPRHLDIGLAPARSRWFLSAIPAWRGYGRTVQRSGLPGGSGSTA